MHECNSVANFCGGSILVAGDRHLDVGVLRERILRRIIGICQPRRFAGHARGLGSSALVLPHDCAAVAVIVSSFAVVDARVVERDLRLVDMNDRVNRRSLRNGGSACRSLLCRFRGDRNRHSVLAVSCIADISIARASNRDIPRLPSLQRRCCTQLRQRRRCIAIVDVARLGLKCAHLNRDVHFRLRELLYCFTSRCIDAGLTAVRRDIVAAEEAVLWLDVQCTLEGFCRFRHHFVAVNLLRRQRDVCPLNVVITVGVLPHRPGLAVRCNRVANIIRVSCCVAGDKGLRDLIADGDISDSLAGLLRNLCKDPLKFGCIIRCQVIAVFMVAGSGIRVQPGPRIRSLLPFVDTVVIHMRSIRAMAGNTVHILVDLAAFRILPIRSLQSQSDAIHRRAAARPIPVILTGAALLEVSIVGNAIFCAKQRAKCLAKEVLRFNTRLHVDRTALRVLEDHRPVHRLLRNIITFIFT